MYLEILHEVVNEYLIKDIKTPITIELTPFIYQTLQFELNSVCKLNTDVPIESITFASLVLYGRTITIISGKELNDRFERKMVEKLTALAFK